MRVLFILMFLMTTTASAGDICIESPYLSANSEDERDLLRIRNEIAIALERFPSLGQAFASRLPALCLSGRMDNAHAYLDVPRNRIVISRSLSKDMQTAVMLHELRHLDQIFTGSCPSDDLAMKEYARAVFAMEADASAISLLVAWDMKESGNGAAWSALSSWPSQSDIAERFADEMAISGDIALATEAAFTQWYASDDRIRRYYFASCSDYLDRQDADHALPRYQLIGADFLQQLCRLPDGTRYRCNLPEVRPRAD